MFPTHCYVSGEEIKIFNYKIHNLHIIRLGDSKYVILPRETCSRTGVLKSPDRLNCVA